jgi:hypothetical protein
MKKVLAVCALMLLLSSALLAQVNNDLPLASIGGHKDGMVTAQELLTVGKIDCSNPGFVVSSFALTMHASGGLVTKTCNTATFDQGIIDLLSSARPGQKIIFEEIKVTNADGVTKDLAPLMFKLK